MKDFFKTLGKGLVALALIGGLATGGYYLGTAIAADKVTVQPNTPDSDTDVDIDSDLEEGTVLPFTFDGDSITGYLGADDEITLPLTYSLGDVLKENVYFQENVELDMYLMEKEMSFHTVEDQEAMYPITVYKNSGDPVVLSRRDDFWEILTTEDFPVCIVEETQEYVVGNDFQVKNIFHYAFELSAFSKVIIPEGYVSIGDDAFTGCKNLSEIVLPHSIRKIGLGAFSGCPFEKIVLPEGLEEIGGYAFMYCKNLKSIVLPSTLKTVVCRAFQEIDNLEKIYISDIQNLYVWKGNYADPSDALFTYKTNSEPKLTIYCASADKPAWATYNGNDLFRACNGIYSSQHKDLNLPVVYGATLEQFNAA